MTKKEAIELFKRMRSFYEGVLFCDFDNRMKQALDLAIKALMAYRDCKHCTHNFRIGNLKGCEIWDCDFEDMRGADND